MRDETRPRVLIGTLYSGENELDACRASVRQQEYGRCEHFVLRNLPNKEAHDRLYRTFMDAHEEYDLFVKLDADMVFRDNESLGALVSVFEGDPSVDHAMFAVRDWYSERLIEGLHAFSDRARWRRPDESLFVDESPVVPGERVEIWDDPAPLVDHAPDPSGLQAFRFGVHRALKVLQSGRDSLNLRQSLEQGRELAGCWRKFERTGDVRLAHALLGAERVLKGRLSGSLYAEEHETLETLYEKEVASVTVEEVENRLDAVWGSWLRRWTRWARAVGPARITRAGARSLRSRM